MPQPPLHRFYMSKLPAFQFYPGDWRKDVGVQSLDYEARGIWFEILCLMHESERRGVLTLNGRSMPDEALSRLLGITLDLLKQNLSKIEAHGVASREDGTGALVCRRMVRDENLRKVRSDAGKQGGNPNLLKQNQTTPVKQKPTPSVSSSSSVSSSDNNHGASPLPPEKKEFPKSAIQRRVEKLFNRRETTVWDGQEKRAWDKSKTAITATAEEDFALLEWFYSLPSSEETYRRHDLGALLNNWNTEIDRARRYQMTRGNRGAADLYREVGSR